jgi:hypothetical protein
MSIPRTTREGPDDDRFVGRGLNDGWSAKANRKAHWENVYSTNGETGVSWYQTEPRLSLQLIRSVAPTAGGQIIGVGGGASLLVDRLLALPLEKIAVFDIKRPR